MRLVTLLLTCLLTALIVLKGYAGLRLQYSPTNAKYNIFYTYTFIYLVKLGIPVHLVLGPKNEYSYAYIIRCICLLDFNESECSFKI